MSGPVLSKIYPPPVVDKAQILRYAASPNADGQTLELLEECLAKLQDKLCYKVCFAVYDLKAEEERCDMEGFCVCSADLAKHLQGCRRVLLFAATVGIEVDRLINRYSHISPARAVMMQAIGAERIEALCDVFCADFAAETGKTLRSRFSPGYGDLPLSLQKEILYRLDSARRIGVSLSDSLLMTPTKSVTAFVGVNEEIV